MTNPLRATVSPFCKIGSLMVCHMADVRVTIDSILTPAGGLLLMETPASSPLSVSAHLHSSAWACVFGNQGRAEGGGKPEKDRKGVQRPRCSQERGESCGTQSLSELLKDDL